MTKTLDVLYQSNDNYAMVSGISIVSLLENNQHLDQINIYYLDYQISPENIKKLQSITKKYKNSTLSFIDASEYHDRLEQLKVKPWHGLYITWLKMLAFGDLHIQADRLLFINGHTIVNGALDELIDTDFENNVMALSYDCLLNEHKKAIGLLESDGYFNCGIMLVNIKKWQQESIGRKVEESLANKSDYVIADQDFCNTLFRNQIKLLDVTYNFSSAYYAYDLKRLLQVDNLQPVYFYSYETIMESYYAPKIVHSLFGIVGKPWEEGNKHPNRFLWDRYIRMTPWADLPMPAVKHTYTWTLYDILPSWLFMRLYRIQMNRLYGK